MASDDDEWIPYEGTGYVKLPGNGKFRVVLPEGITMDTLHAGAAIVEEWEYDEEHDPCDLVLRLFPLLNQRPTKMRSTPPKSTPMFWAAFVLGLVLGAVAGRFLL